MICANVDLCMTFGHPVQRESNRLKVYPARQVELQKCKTFRAICNTNIEAVLHLSRGVKKKQQTWVTQLFSSSVSKEFKVWLHILFPPYPSSDHSDFCKMQLFPSAQTRSEFGL